MSHYHYTGYLHTVLEAPDSEAAGKVDALVFGQDDLAHWSNDDLDHAIEWQNIPARKIQTGDGIKLEGHFQSVTSIDSLSENDPRHWVPLTTIGLTDGRFPVDTARFPIIEVTYRCTSEHAHPVWMWTYEGGSHFNALPKSAEWITVAKSLQHFGFPSRIDNLIFRLYSSSRSAESFELKSVRFRAMTDTERNAVDADLKAVRQSSPPKPSPILNEFMPLGVYMDAETSKRLATSMGISLSEYWDFVMEDLVTHDHNTIALSHVDNLSPDEHTDLQKKCIDNGIKILTRHEFPINGTPEQWKERIAKTITPHVNSEAIFCRGFSGEPAESKFQNTLKAKAAIEAADPNHPVSLITRYPNAYGLFAPFFQASGVGHFYTSRPWDVGRMVRTHVGLSNAQQFWVAAAAFMYPTQTPEWSTCPEMRLMINLSFSNGARGMFSYSYHNDPLWVQGRVQRTLTGPFLAFSDLWEELAGRMRIVHTMAPLLLDAQVEDEMDDWFVNGVKADNTSLPAPGISPVSLLHLRGGDYSLYITVNNNVREMASVNYTIPADAAPGMEMYDITEYLTTHEWTPLDRNRHDEMFPGKESVLLVASPERCEQWRTVMAGRLIQIDHAKLKYNLNLARAYGLPCGEIEATLDSMGSDISPEILGVVRKARGDLTNLLHGNADFAKLNSTLYSVRASICACDGALCRLMQTGKKDKARDFGEKLIPIGAELTQLRLELKRGNAGKYLDSAVKLRDDSLLLLDKIRRSYSAR